MTDTNDAQITALALLLASQGHDPEAIEGLRQHADRLTAPLNIDDADEVIDGTDLAISNALLDLADLLERAERQAAKCPNFASLPLRNALQHFFRGSAI